MRTAPHQRPDSCHLVRRSQMVRSEEGSGHVRRNGSALLNAYAVMLILPRAHYRQHLQNTGERAPHPSPLTGRSLITERLMIAMA